MITFKDRLVEEKKQLNNKMKKLQDFMQSEQAKKIDSVQLTLLNVQMKAMETYSQCLLERIVRLEN